MHLFHKQEEALTPILPTEQRMQPEEPLQKPQSLTSAKKAGKRIMSKSEYIRAQSKRTSTGLFGTGLYVACVTCGMMTVFMVAVLWNTAKVFSEYREEATSRMVIGLGAITVCTIALCAGTWFLRQYALHILKQAKEMETGIPLTRANTADLPAPDSLVRASSEPEQAQQAVLLRAAGEGQE